VATKWQFAGQNNRDIIIMSQGMNERAITDSFPGFSFAKE
jgi:hypothetical protein